MVKGEHHSCASVSRAQQRYLRATLNFFQTENQPPAGTSFGGLNGAAIKTMTSAA